MRVQREDCKECIYFHKTDTQPCSQCARAFPTDFEHYVDFYTKREIMTIENIIARYQYNKKALTVKLPTYAELTEQFNQVVEELIKLRDEVEASDREKAFK